MNTKKITNDILSIQNTYNIYDGLLLNGARKIKDYNFVNYIGGNNKGECILNVTVSNSCVYYLLLQYISFEPNLSFKVDINNFKNDKIYYVDFIPHWSINSPSTIKIPVLLNNGNNTLKFYGNGTENSPYLGEFKIALPPTTNNLSMGLLGNNAFVDANTNFVSAIGGPKDGSVTITVNVSTKGLYNLVFSYLCGESLKTLSLEVNGIDDGKIHTVLPNGSWDINNTQNFTIPIDLNGGNNTIKFHGDGINYGPSLGSILIKSIYSDSSSIFAASKSYKVSSGTLGNGAIIDKNNVVTKLGGVYDGYCIMKVPVNVFGDYLIKLIYSNGDKPLKIDINGIETETIYNLSSKSSIFSTTLPLVCGVNKLKFHGNGKDMAPDLLDFTIDLIKDNSATAFNGGVLNKATILPKGVITGIGGLDNGMYIMKYNAKDFGWYDLYLTADTSKGSMIELDIEPNNKELTYYLSTIDSSVVTVFNTSLQLEKGVNTLTFHSSGTSTAPDILNIEIKLRKIIKTSFYNFIDGTLENGAVKNLEEMLVENIGGINNGSVTLNINITNAKLYDLNILYLAESIASPLKIDIIANEKVTTSTICILPSKDINYDFIFEEFKVTLPLVKGVNNIKFYGNEINNVPKLKNVKISEAIKQDSQPFSKIYELTTADFYGSAKVDPTIPGFIRGIGGSNNGRAVMNLELPKATEYRIDIKYLNMIDKEGFILFVNNASDGNIIFCPKTNSLKKEDAKTMTLIVFLPQNSSLVFFGRTSNSTLLLGSFTISEVKLVPSKPYKISSINFFNGAKKYKGEDFITLIGGPHFGKINLTVDTLAKGIYDLGFKYICVSNEREIEVNIHENSYYKTYKLPLTDDWEIINAQTYTIPLMLKEGTNIITLEGNGYNYSPIIGKFNLVANTNMSVITYDVNDGSFKNGAKVNNYGLVTNIGGPNKGEVTVKVYVEKEGNYNLSIEYKPISETLSLELFQNNNIYHFEKEKDTQEWSLTDMPTLKTKIYLSKGESIITFRGLDSTKNNNDYAPFLRKFTLTREERKFGSLKKLPKGTYDLTKGKLENGADIFEDFVIDLGGLLNGSVTITVNVDTTDKYFMIINYVAIEKSCLMFNINGEENGNIYLFQPTNCFNDQEEVEIKLKKGDNSIKFYGVKNIETPRLSTISIKQLNN